MMDIDLSNNQNLISVGKINAVLAVTDAMNPLRKANIANVSQIQNFMKGIQQFVIGMVKKPFDKSLLGSSFLWATSLFDPDVLFCLQTKTDGH